MLPWPRWAFIRGVAVTTTARTLVLETMGWSKADVFAALLDADAAARATAAFAVAYEDIVASGAVTEIPGARAVFRELRAAGVRVCLSTGFAPSTRDALLRALGWEAEIDLALSPADVGRGRPAPDMILGAMAAPGRRGPTGRRRRRRHGERPRGRHGGPGRGGDRGAQRRPRPGHPRGGTPHGFDPRHHGSDRPTCKPELGISTENETCSIIAHTAPGDPKQTRT